MGVDAASGWVLDELERCNPLPAASDMAALDVPKGSFVWIYRIDC